MDGGRRGKVRWFAPGFVGRLRAIFFVSIFCSSYHASLAFIQGDRGIEYKRELRRQLRGW